MATKLYSSFGHKQPVSHSPPSKIRRDEDLPAAVSKFDSANKGTHFPLKKPAGAKLRKAGVEDTIYKDYPDDVEDWGKFYLKNTVTMEVIGVVEGISCLCDQLVLMTCEDKQVYAYDEEELHVVASSMEELLNEGINYPASETYYNGEAFKDMTKEDWEKVREEEEHKDKKPGFKKEAQITGLYET